MSDVGITVTDILPTDVRAVRRALKIKKLPMELILNVMDHADYYPVVRAEHNTEQEIRARSHGAGPVSTARLAMVSPPIHGNEAGEPEEFRRAKKVTFKFEGHDQGWGGEAPGMYWPAYSWYEVCIFRRDGSADPAGEDITVLPAISVDHHNVERFAGELAGTGWIVVQNSGSYVWKLQSNCIARRDYEAFTIEWVSGSMDGATPDNGSGDGEGFVNALRAGDCIGLWMRAQYPGWANYLRSASIEVMWEIN